MKTKLLPEFGVHPTDSKRGRVIPGNTLASFVYQVASTVSKSAIDVILASAGRKLPEDVPVAVVAEIKQLEARLGELRASLQG